jgi:hypothetical protein
MNIKFNRQWLFLLALALVLSGCSGQAKTIKVNVSEEAKTQATVTSPVVKQPSKTVVVAPITTAKPPAVATPTDSVAEIPTKYELAVAFAQQAPFGNWDAAHEEACEEASMVMADKYFRHQSLTETIMEEELQKILKWQTDNGYQLDLTAAETVKNLNDYFGLSAHLSREVTVDRIKYELFKGNLVIIPAAGRELHNPNFKGAGPIYHMLVIKGYNDKEFITNDPGTRKGNGYRYSYDTIINAIHDWNHERAAGGMTNAEMAQGEKVIVIVDGLTN